MLSLVWPGVRLALVGFVLVHHMISVDDLARKKKSSRFRVASSVFGGPPAALRTIDR